MKLFTLSEFDRCVAAFDAVLAAVTPEQYSAQSPCAEWAVRDVLNHVITGNMTFEARLTGQPAPDRSVDHTGVDPLSSWRASAARLRAQFAGDGVLDQVYDSPFGQRPGAFLLTMRVNDTLIHAWDIAKATGQSTDLDSDLAQACLTLVSQIPVPRGPGGMFAEQCPIPDGASAADRLAAFTGRAV
jgi:uncharacterized protein (TIGR03086 family)